MRRLSTRLLLAAAAAVLFGRAPLTAAVVASSGDASITHDESAGTWTLAAGGTTLKLALDTGRDFSIVSLSTSSGVAWTSGGAPDSLIHLGDRSLPLGNRAAGFKLQNVTVDTFGDRLQLHATFELASAGLRLTRHYAIANGAPAFEAWTTYAPTAASARDLSDLTALQIIVPAGQLRWINGLQGSAADVRNDASFTLQQKTLDSGEMLTLGADGRSSERTVPWIAVDGEKDEFFATLMWSGAWSLSITRGRTGLEVSFGLAAMRTTPREQFDGPHVVFGAVRGGLANATAALRSYIVSGIREGRPLTPLVTYNTWFAYATQVDERSMRAEMERAASLGVELFVIDAGWYERSDSQGPLDFSAGLGSWRADPARFPDGMKPLADYARSLGMRFGLWVEPERIDLSLLGDAGVDEEWLATNGGGYGSERIGQICLAGSAGRTWLVDRIGTLIDDVQPDYIKWDNNGWINCDRDGHGHGGTDGNFAHVRGLYDVLTTLRERYPTVMFENVSGGGNRLDLGMIKYTDVAWMDDRTAPSAHVRHNVEGLSVVFPPAYLLSFVTNHDTEPVHDSPDLSLYIRSRMASALGLCFRGAELSEADAANFAHEIDIYKGLRQTIGAAAASLLSGQATLDNGPPWDVLQETAEVSQQVLICAFQADTGVDRVLVKPTGLDSTTMYQVQSVDTGDLGEASGADLMTDGIDIRQSPNTAAHILIITPRP
jgi:alpha-galactosidase